MAHPRMYDDSDPAILKLREICLALPEVFEKEAWGECTFRVTGGSMFAMTDNNHHGSGHLAVWVKAPAMVQEILVNSEPEALLRSAVHGQARMGRRPHRLQSEMGSDGGDSQGRIFDVGAEEGSRQISMTARRNKAPRRGPLKPLRYQYWNFSDCADDAHHHWSADRYRIAARRRGYVDRAGSD